MSALSRQIPIALSAIILVLFPTLAFGQMGITRTWKDSAGNQDLRFQQQRT